MQTKENQSSQLQRPVESEKPREPEESLQNGQGPKEAGGQRAHGQDTARSNQDTQHLCLGRISPVPHPSHYFLQDQRPSQNWGDCTKVGLPAPGSRVRKAGADLLTCVAGGLVTCSRVRSLGAGQSSGAGYPKQIFRKCSLSNFLSLHTIANG